MGSVIEVRGQTDVVQFRPVDAATGAFNEAWLQDVLRRHPEVLPVEEFGPVFHPLVPVGKEMPTTAGPIDNVFISHAGYLVIVETKLWRNPEAKREAVVQVIDYASALTRLTYAEFDDLVQEYLRKYEGVAASLQEWIERRIEPVDVGFQNRVARSLRLGRFLLLIVTDHARPSLLDMLSRMNGFPSLSMDMGIVELRPFAREGDQGGGILLVPYVAGRTEIVERTVVEVTVPSIPGAQVTVRQERHQDERASSKRRPPLTSEAAFWELMQDQAPHAAEAGRRLIDGLREDGIDFTLSESSIKPEVAIPGTDVTVPLCYLNASGRLASWPQTIAGRIRLAGLPEGFADPYVNGMRTLFRASPARQEPSTRVHELDVDAFRKLILDFVNQIESASS